MSIQVAGKTPANLVEVDPTQSAARVTLRPQEVLAWNSIGAQSGTVTGLAAGAPLFSFRNSGSNNIALRRVGIGFICTTVPTTAQIIDFGLMLARSFTASDTGGTALALSGATANGKHRTSLANPTSIAAAIATTAALTAGTRTLDPNFVGQVGGWAGAVGTIVAPTASNVFQRDDGSDYPIVLAPNEGFVVAAVSALANSGAGRLYVNAEFAELATAAF